MIVEAVRLVSCATNGTNTTTTTMTEEDDPLRPPFTPPDPITTTTTTTTTTNTNNTSIHDPSSITNTNTNTTTTVTPTATNLHHHHHHHHHDTEPSKIETQQQDQQKDSDNNSNNGDLKGCGEVCQGCRDVIADRFLLRVNSRSWHQTCLRCCVCQLALDRQPSCFIREHNVYCKTDYTRCGEGARGQGGEWGRGQGGDKGSEGEKGQGDRWDSSYNTTPASLFAGALAIHQKSPVHVCNESESDQKNLETKAAHFLEVLDARTSKESNAATKASWKFATDINK
ncbi:hypothetical protein Pmani_021208 [Petrolisthes manimaculis]|uniref:LIM zinc-binding domain-containing protein n=1 Tax=Petrolisthes manimaculis TaxID=1843537 RepID=A0AAE1PEL7_9EUCA|nr:hypothetical protein Pmani_021208 [Petrolisthes manimaculis]